MNHASFRMDLDIDSAPNILFDLEGQAAFAALLHPARFVLERRRLVIVPSWKTSL